jgi:hypothetical protein
MLTYKDLKKKIKARKTKPIKLFEEISENGNLNSIEKKELIDLVIDVY